MNVSKGRLAAHAAPRGDNDFYAPFIAKRDRHSEFEIREQSDRCIFSSEQHHLGRPAAARPDRPRRRPFCKAQPPRPWLSNSGELRISQSLRVTEAVSGTPSPGFKIQKTSVSLKTLIPEFFESREFGMPSQL